jgi:hypothetical protein
MFADTAHASRAEGHDEHANIDLLHTYEGNVTAISELENYEISGCHGNEFSNVNTLHERNLYSTSRTTEESSILVYRVYSESIDNIISADT